MSRTTHTIMFTCYSFGRKPLVAWAATSGEVGKGVLHFCVRGTAPRVVCGATVCGEGGGGNERGQGQSLTPHRAPFPPH